MEVARPGQASQHCNPTDPREDREQREHAHGMGRGVPLTSVMPLKRATWQFATNFFRRRCAAGGRKGASDCLAQAIDPIQGLKWSLLFAACSAAQLISARAKPLSQPWQSASPRRPVRRSPIASSRAAGQLIPRRSSVAASAAEESSRCGASDDFCWAIATAVAIGHIVSSMRRRSCLQQAVGDVSQPPGSGCEAARERLIRGGGTAAAFPGEGQS